MLVVRPVTSRRLRTAGAAALMVFVLAFAARMVTLFHVGVVTGVRGYDAAAYYAAADALLHGRAPYAGDFVFLHPPVVLLVGLPFALLGSVTTASTGFLLENVAFAAMSSATAALIVLIGHRAGMSRWTSLAGGAVFAVWSTTALTGGSARLEPLGDLLLALGLLLVGPGAARSQRNLVLAGVTLGLLVDVKLWWVAPVALVLALAVLPRYGVRRSAAAVVVAASTCLVVDLPFLIASHGHMWASVVGAQAGRPDLQLLGTGDYGRLPATDRLSQLATVGGVIARLGPDPARASVLTHVATVVVGLVVAVTCVLALRTRLGRVVVPLLVLQVAMLLAVPVFFSYYGDFVGVALCLVIAASCPGRDAAAAGRRMSRRRAVPSRRMVPAGLLTAGAAATLVAATLAPRADHVENAPDARLLSSATAHVRCVVSDTPRVLIELDALDRSFSRECRNLVDIQGVGYGAGPDAAARRVGPDANRAWRQTISRYLRSGDAVALGDPGVSGALSRPQRRSLTQGRIIARSRGVVVIETARTRR